MTLQITTLLLGVLISPCGLAAQVPATDQIAVTVIASNQKNAPLQIVGFKLPATFGEPPKVIVENTTSKEVTAFLVDAMVGAYHGDRAEVLHKGSLAVAHSSTPNNSWPEERTIPPWGRREARETILSSSIIAFWARDLRSPCLRVVAAVSRVEFADGTVWTAAGPSSNLWRDSLPRGSGACTHEQSVVDSLRRLEGSARRESNGVPTQLPGLERESYTFSCALREVRGKLMAVCPF